MASTKIAQRVAVIAGLGNSSGTGAASARLFAKSGYSVALVARRADSVKKLADEITASGGHAAPFPVPSYSPKDISAVWDAIRTKFPRPQYVVRVAIFNVAHGVWKSFLDVTPEDVQECLQVNVAAGFAFSREAIIDFKGNDIEQGNGKRGALIFTGATSSIRGNLVTSAFSAGKSGLRSLSQSLAKEFGKENIHVSHAIIDGKIITDRHRANTPNADWLDDEDARLNPEGIATAYLYLVNQDRTSWTWELDLRPAHEKW